MRTASNDVSMPDAGPVPPCTPTHSDNSSAAHCGSPSSVAGSAGNRLATLEQQSAERTREIEALGVQVECINRDQPKLKDDLNGQMDAIKTNVDGIKTDVDGIKTDVDGIKTDIDSIKTRIDGIMTDVDSIKADIDGMKNSQSRIEAMLEVLLQGP